MYNARNVTLPKPDPTMFSYQAGGHIFMQEDQVRQNLKGMDDLDFTG
ncbi:MAG: hypothetical protein ABI791_09080 [Acidobacteriota bacterium]